MAKILIADDDLDILSLLEYNLNKEGHEVFTAPNGKIALDLAEEVIPDLIILDIMMPVMDGVAVCEKLRMKKKFQSTLIIFLTARTEDYTQIACYENGGDDFIMKPITPRVLVTRINALVRRQQMSNQLGNHQIRVADLTIDLEKFLVTKSGLEMTLAKKEFELLTLLVSKPGKLFSREEIFNKVWGIDTVVSDRTIDVHIRKIREKIGDEFIKTVKGIGYRFEPI